MREENQEIYMAREREKKRDTDRPNKPGAILQYLGLCSARNTGRRGG